MSRSNVDTLRGDLMAKKNLSDKNGCVGAMLPLASMTYMYGLTRIQQTCVNRCADAKSILMSVKKIVVENGCPDAKSLLSVVTCKPKEFSR